MNHASLETRVKNKDVNIGIIWDLYIKVSSTDFGLNDSTTRIPHTLQPSAACDCDQSIISPLSLHCGYSGSGRGGPHCKTCTGERPMTMTCDSDQNDIADSR